MRVPFITISSDSVICGNCQGRRVLIWNRDDACQFRCPRCELYPDILAWLRCEYGPQTSVAFQRNMRKGSQCK